MLAFWKSLIIAVPVYKKTATHKHSMLHIIASDEPVTVELTDSKQEGNLVFIGQDVKHRVTFRTLNTVVLLIDPSTAFADAVNDNYLKDQLCEVRNINYNPQALGKTRDEIIEVVKSLTVDLGISSTVSRVTDPRVKFIIEGMEDRQHVFKTVNELAREVALSTDRLSHLFKQETKWRLKNFLLMHKLKYVYCDFIDGKSLTQAAMDMGFSDSAHLSNVSKRLTGIAITDFLKK